MMYSETFHSEHAQLHPGVITAKQRVDGYADMARARVADGWDAYALTIMFNHIPRSERAIGKMMEREAERLYATLLTRIIRKPSSPHERHNRPVWMLFPDYPITKRERRDKSLTTANNGRHLHGTALIAPNSRLKQPLDEHLAENASRYVRRPIHRVYAEPIAGDPGFWIDYALKSITTGRAEDDEIIVLPSATSELS